MSLKKWRNALHRLAEFLVRGNGPYRDYKSLYIESRLEKGVQDKLILQRLNQLLFHAAETVPYWRRVLESERVSLPLKSVDDLANIPILTKDIIRSEGDGMISTKRIGGSTYRNTSGGSTGEPIVLIQDEAFRRWSRAATSLSRSWKGCSPYSSILRIWGNEQDLDPGSRKWLRSIRNFLINRREFNAFRQDEFFTERVFTELERNPPDIVESYVDPIYQIARNCRQDGIEAPGIRAIHSAAGTLTPEIRNELEAVFGAEVFNHYGSRELSAIAAECAAHNGLHVFGANQFVEVVDDRGFTLPAGEEGEVLITNLRNFTMPLIRYRIGDRGILSDNGECSCGVKWPMLEGITGRTDELFFAMNGDRISGEYFTHLLYFSPEVKRFQVVQEKADLVIFRIITRTDSVVSSELRQNLIKGTRKTMGPECRVEIEEVDDILPSPSGKMRYTINRLAR